MSIEQRLRDLDADERAEALAEALATARERVLELSERLPDRDDVAELTRRAGERLFRERLAARRRAERRRRRRLVAVGSGLAGLGLAIGWLTAPRRGLAADQVARLRAGGGPHAPLDMRADGQPPAEVALVPDSGDGNQGWDGPRSD
jgi:hypothetical protein